MNVILTQAYIEPGVKFPFSHVMQAFLDGELSALASPSAAFTKKYGPDFNLVLYLSAKRELTNTEIKGPGIYKKTRDIEYTLFLPFEKVIEQADMCRSALTFLCDGIREVFARVGIVAPEFDAAKQAELIDHICGAPDMLDGAWPAARIDPLH